MSNIVDFQSRRDAFLQKQATRRADLARDRAARLDQLKSFGASFADQLRFTLETERLLAGGAADALF